jgi:hypothetical protein
VTTAAPHGALGEAIVGFGVAVMVNTAVAHVAADALFAGGDAPAKRRGMELAMRVERRT